MQVKTGYRTQLSSDSKPLLCIEIHGSILSLGIQTALHLCFQKILTLQISFKLQIANQFQIQISNFKLQISFKNFLHCKSVCNGLLILSASLVKCIESIHCI